MRRRRVLALVLATALIFALAGTALGYWVLPDGGPSAADCNAAVRYFETIQDLSDPGDRLTEAGENMTDACVD